MEHTYNNIELNVNLEKLIRTGLLEFGLFSLAPFEVQFTKEERMNLEEKNKNKSIFALLKEDYIRLGNLEDKYQFYNSKGIKLFIKEIKANYDEKIKLTLVAVVEDQKEEIEIVSAITRNELYDKFILDLFEEVLDKELAELYLEERKEEESQLYE